VLRIAISATSLITATAQTFYVEIIAQACVSYWANLCVMRSNGSAVRTAMFQAAAATRGSLARQDVRPSARSSRLRVVGVLCAVYERTNETTSHLAAWRLPLTELCHWDHFVAILRSHNHLFTATSRPACTFTFSCGLTVDGVDIGPYIPSAERRFGRIRTPTCLPNSYRLFQTSRERRSNVTWNYTLTHDVGTFSTLNSYLCCSSRGSLRFYDC